MNYIIKDVATHHPELLKGFNKTSEIVLPKEQLQINLSKNCTSSQMLHLKSSLQGLLDTQRTYIMNVREMNKLND